MAVRLKRAINSYLKLKKTIYSGFTAGAALLLITLLGGTVTTPAQSFAVPVEYIAGSHPYGVAPGDFNGDGKTDLAAANNSSQTVSVFLGNGGSSFNAKTDYAVGANPYSIVAVDLNKDGKIDVVTANSFSQTANISVLLGNGNGTFQGKVDYAFSSLEPKSICAVDLNSDNNLDIVTLNGVGAVVFLGNGDGTLRSPVTYAASSTSYSVTTADFNADSKLDLAVTSYGNTSGLVSILLGKGDGTFMAPVNYVAGPSPFNIAAGDFNGDSKADLATANAQVDDISILLGNGDGTFQAKVNYTAGASSFPYGIAVADLNSDGKSDVLVAGNGFGLSSLKGNGDGTFRAPNIFRTGGVFATIVDLNLDGKPDVVSGLQANSIAVFMNQTGSHSLSGTIRDNNGTLLDGVSLFLTGGAEEFASTDATGTYNFPDLAAGGSYSVRPSRQNYVFAPANQSFANLSSNVTADFTGTLQGFSISGRVRDNFGNPMSTVVTLSGTQAGSVATLADGSYLFSSLPGSGNYTLTTSYPKFVFAPPSAAVNNLSSNRTVNFTGSIATYTISGGVKNVDTGTDIEFLPVLLTGTKTGSTATTTTGYSFGSLPVDGDYTINVFAATGTTLFTNVLMLPPTSQTFSGLSSNMTANFNAKRLNFSTGDLNPLGIARGDLNGDGKLDLAVATTTGNNIHVLLGNADGTFNTQTPYLASTNPTFTIMADFNADGKLDVASSGGFLSIHIGNGDGTLKDRVTYTIPGQGQTLKASDFNGDNKLDLAVLSSGNNLNILLGNGDGTFGPVQTKNVPTAIGSVLSGDFNSDGKLDLILLGFPNSMLLLNGNGDGTFANAVSFNVANEVRKATVADLNGDGKLDVAVASNRAFTTLLGNGNGTFQAGVGNTLTFDTVEIINGDFDSDNKPDLAIGSGNGGFAFSAGNGDGTFNPAVFIGGGGTSTGAMVSGDFNLDGKEDVAYTSQGSNAVSVLLNTSLTRLPSVQFSSSSVTVNEGAGSVVLTVTRTTGVSGAAKVNFVTGDQAGTQSCATVNQRASSRCDYSSLAGTLEFASGEVSKTISVPIVDDSYLEGNESFTLTLLNPDGASLGAPTQVTVNIVDNDSASGSNPTDIAQFLVSQHYRDFLNRQPDSDGLAFWTNQITSCGADAGCTEVKRISVSASFFLSIEFQQSGYLVERFYKAAFGDATGTSTFGSNHQLAVPVVRFSEFLQDTQRIGRGVIVLQPGWEQALESNKQAYALEFVQTTKFMTTLPTTMTPAEFVDKLNQNAGNVLSLSERTGAINLFGGAATSSSTTARAQAVRQIAEDTDLYNGEFNRAFVLAQYFGYLRRNPNDAPESTLDYTGYDFWLTKLNQFNGNYINAEMVKAFLSSIEYRQRFGP